MNIVIPVGGGGGNVITGQISGSGSSTLIITGLTFEPTAVFITTQWTGGTSMTNPLYSLFKCADYSKIVYPQHNYHGAHSDYSSYTFALDAPITLTYSNGALTIFVNSTPTFNTGLTYTYYLTD